MRISRQSRWTGPSLLSAYSPKRESWERGAVLQLVVDQAELYPVAVEVLTGLGSVLNVPVDTRIPVSTMSKNGSLSRSLLLEEVTEASFARLCDDGDPFFTGALGESRLDLYSSLLPNGRWALMAAVSTPHAIGEAVDVDAFTGFLSTLNPKAEVVWGGVDVQHRFDVHEFCLFPLNRSDGKMVEIAESGLVGAYYWITILGERVLDKLTSRPAELALSTIGPVTMVRLSESPDDTEVRDRILVLREWLHPAMSGWMVGYESFEDGRLFEGPVVPTCAARMITAFVEGRVGLPDAAEMAEAISVDASILKKATGVSIELGPVQPEDEALASDGILGTIAALDRGIIDGWIDEEPFSSLNFENGRVEASGPVRSLLLMLLVIQNLVNEFDKTSNRGNQRVLEVRSIDVKS